MFECDEEESIHKDPIGPEVTLLKIGELVRFDLDGNDPVHSTKFVGNCFKHPTLKDNVILGIPHEIDGVQTSSCMYLDASMKTLKRELFTPKDGKKCTINLLDNPVEEIIINSDLILEW